MSVDAKKEEKEEQPIKVAGECEIGSVLDCATCKRCSLVCPTELDLEKVVRISRYLKDPKGSHRNIFKITSKFAAMAETQSWLKAGETGTDIAYFPGCSALFDILLQRDTNYAGAAEAAVLTLNKLGFKPEIIYGCCGHDLYYSGALDEFELVKQELLKKLEGKKIVVGCGECFHMLKNIYEADVVTFAEFVLEQKPKFEKTDLKTTYHDPCRLGRYNDVYDAPRELLKEASDFREMENIREEATCCSVSAWLNCNKHAREVRFNRLREAKDTGADYIVTACNKCSIHLDCVHYELNKDEVKDLEDIKVIGFEEVIGYALGVYDPFKEEKSYDVPEIKGKFLEPIEIEKDLEKYIDEDLVEQAFRCTSCKNCMVVCPVHYDTPGMLMEVFRPELVKRGYAPEKHTKIANVLEKTGNAFGAEGAKIKLNPKAKYVYFPGCVAQYRRDDVFDATIKIMDLIGVDYEIPEGLVCCGSVLKRTGHSMDFLIEQNMKLLKDKPIITSCAGCYATLKKDYKGLEVYHITDIIKENLDKLPLKPVNKKVMYHDPCHLGRKFDYYEIPREIIEAIPGIELVPFEKEKENAQCCGAGGGVKSAKPELANELAQKRMDEAKDKAADMVVSSCPFCELNLGDNNNDIPVVDILNLIMESLGVEA